MNQKRKILFVGAFNRKTKDGSSGGQLFACTSLMESNLTNLFDFIKLDTTAETVPAPPVYKRLSKVVGRLLRILFYLFFKKIDTILIFSSAKLSFIEKGLMAIIYSLAGKKVIFAPRSGLSLIDYEKSKFMKWYMPIVINKATFVICQGNTWKEFYQKISNKNEDKFIIINNWIDFNYYFNETKLKCKNEIPKIIYVGWLEEYKGIKDLLVSLKMVRDKNLIFECEIYGNGSLYCFCEDFIEKNDLSNLVKLKGWANHPTKIETFKSAYIYVLPSHFEGFPNALLEAMSSEIAVIATNVGAVEDILINNVNGILIDSKNENMLADAICKLLLDKTLRENLASNAVETVKQSFTVSNAVDKLKKIL